MLVNFDRGPEGLDLIRHLVPAVKGVAPMHVAEYLTYEQQ